jgi:hypothetical protein
MERPKLYLRALVLCEEVRRFFYFTKITLEFNEISYIRDLDAGTETNTNV